MTKEEANSGNGCWRSGFLELQRLNGQKENSGIQLYRSEGVKEKKTNFTKKYYILENENNILKSFQNQTQSGASIISCYPFRLNQ